MQMEPQSFLIWQLALQLIQKGQDQYLPNNRTWKIEQLWCFRILTDGRKLITICCSEENLPKEKKIATQIIFRGNEKGWMTRTRGWMAERSLAWKTRCSFKEKRNAVLDAFSGHLREEVKTAASNLLNKGCSDHTRRHDLSLTCSWYS